MARIGVIIGSEHIEVISQDSKVLYNDLAYVSWNSKAKDISHLGSEAKNLQNEKNKVLKTVPIFKHGEITNLTIFEKAFKQIFDPIKDNLIEKELIIALPTDIMPKTKNQIEKHLKVYNPKSMIFIPNFFLLALLNQCNIEDEYGTIILNIGYARASAGIVADKKIINFKIIDLGEDYLNNEIVIFFKEHYQLVLGNDEIYRVKYNLASLTITKQEIQILVKGFDLLTNEPKEVLVSELDVRKIFTNLFANYRSMITVLLEEAPAYIRTGISKNGLIIYGNLANIHGIEDYFTGFFEFPALTINKQNIDLDKLLNAAKTIDFQEWKKD